MLFIRLLRIFGILLVFWGDRGFVNSSCTDYRYGNPGKTCRKIKDAKFQIRGVKIVPMWEYLLLIENKKTRHKRSAQFQNQTIIRPTRPHLNITHLNSGIRKSHLVRPPLPFAPPRLNQILMPRRLHENHQQQVEPAPIYSIHVEAGRPVLNGEAGNVEYRHPRSKKIKRQEAYPTAPPEESEQETTTVRSRTRKKCKDCKDSKEKIVEELIEAQEKVIENALNIKPIPKTEVDSTVFEEFAEGQGKIIEEIVGNKDKDDNHEVFMKILEAQGQIFDELKDKDDEKKVKNKENKEVVETILEAQEKILENLKNVTDAEVKKEDEGEKKIEVVAQILETQDKILENINDAKKTGEERQEKVDKIEAVGQILETQGKILENLKNATEAEEKKEEEAEKQEVVEKILETQEKVLKALHSSEIATEDQEDKKVVGDIIEAQEKVLKAALEVHDNSEEKEEEEGKDEKAVVGNIIEAQEKILKTALDVSNKEEDKEKSVVKGIVKAQEKLLKSALGATEDTEEEEEKEEEKDEKEVVGDILEAQEKILKGALKIQTQSEEGDEEEDEEEEEEEDEEEKKEEEEEEEEEEEKEERKERRKMKKKEKEKKEKEEKKKGKNEKEQQAGKEGFNIKEYIDKQSHSAKMKIPVIRGKAIVNTTTAIPEKSEWGPNIREEEEPAEYAGKPNIKYSYPPKDTLPLQNCFHNPSGYVCCNLELNNVIEETYKEVREDPAFNPCNLQVVANKVQRATEKMFDHPFETVVSHGDFAQNVNFAGDLVCKLEVDGKFLIAYGTPFKADEAVGPEGPDGSPVPLPTTRFRL